MEAAAPRAIVFVGGVAPSPPVAAALGGADGPVIAADSGLDHARALGYTPTLLVGDLDSVSADGLAWAERTGITIERHRPDKDATDLELALERATAAADEVIVVDGGAGRLDHLLANMALLASPRWSGVTMTGLVGTALVSVVPKGRTRRFDGDPGSVATLLAVGGPAEGVTTAGLRWPLADATLEPGMTLGVSNELERSEATVSVATGTLIVVQPDYLDARRAA